jgi:hypothetical protein
MLHIIHTLVLILKEHLKNVSIFTRIPAGGQFLFRIFEPKRNEVTGDWRTNYKMSFINCTFCQV